MNKNWFKKHVKFIIGMIIGMTIPGIVFAATILYASDEVSYDNTATGFESSDVQGALDELYLLCKGDSPSGANNSSGKAPIKKLAVGDYFTMEPDKDTYTIEKSITGYEEEQKIKPNELTLWRVIKVNGDRTIDAVSEYVSSDEVHFEGITGYANLVGGLQKIAEQYKNKDYTDSVRIIGFNEQISNISFKESFDGSEAAELFEASDLTEGDGVEAGNGEFGDTLYLKDYLLVSNVYKEDKKDEKEEDDDCELGLCAFKVDSEEKVPYWLASRGRDISKDPEIAYFTGRSIDDKGKLKHNDFLRGYNLDEKEWKDYSSANALRPIITLYRGISIKDGKGTKDSPYTLTN